MVGVGELLAKTERILINPLEPNPRHVFKHEKWNLVPDCIAFLGQWKAIQCFDVPKTTKINILTVLETKSLKSRCFQGCIPSEVSQGEPFLASSSFWWLQVLHSSLLQTLISASSFTWLSSLYVSVSEISLCVSLIRPSIIGFRAHPKSRMISEILSLIPPAKTIS